MSHARFIHCARKLYCEPWAILPEMHARIVQIFERRVAGMPNDFDMPEDDNEDARAFDVIDGVGVLPIRGVISKEISALERMSGAVDLDDTEAMLREAMVRDDVRAIVLRVNSPGGTVSGVPEMADQIVEVAAAKPVIAFADGLMASAAYWLAAGATAIYAAKSAEVGSIGVYIAMLDQTRAYEMQGFRREVIKSSETPHKAAGYPGTSLTDDQRRQMQSQVDYLYDQFSGFVSGRRQAPSDSMRGQTFFGQRAVDAGLVDSVSTMEQAIEDARRLAGA